MVFAVANITPHPSSIIHLTSSIMSEVSEAIQAKCLAFGDRIIKLNDYLLKEAANETYLQDC